MLISVLSNFISYVTSLQMSIDRTRPKCR